MSNQEERESRKGPERIDLTVIFRDYFRVLRKMWLRVLILIVAGGVVFTIYAHEHYYPRYTASATYVINIGAAVQNGSDVNESFFNNSAAEQMATTFPYILTSGVLQRQVAKDMNVPAITGTISAKVTPNTNFLVLSVTDGDAQVAYDTLQSVVKNYPPISEVIIGKINMELLDETGVPTVPDNPKNIKNKTIKGCLAGLLIGMLWALAVSVSRKTIRREQDCIRWVNTRCMGSVPHVRYKVRSKRMIQQLCILDENINTNFIEAFQILRNKVEFSAERNHIKSILITSTLAGEGKSTVAVNLALSLAQNGKRVALVDCDLRNPSDGPILGIQPEKGIVDYLKGNIYSKDCLIQGNNIANAPDSFMFMPGIKAVSDGAELLESPKMRRLIAELENQTDFVILDSAPVGLLTDASVLADFTDGAIFVVKRDFAKANHILEGMDQLTDDNIHLMGCILNGDI